MFPVLILAQALSGGICDVDPSACPSQEDVLRAALRRGGYDPTQADIAGAKEIERERQEKVEQVSVRSKPPPRSASDWEVDHDAIASVPHETAADVLGVLPGVYVSNRGLLGQAPHLSLRGFEGTSGQDTEIFVGNVPMNQVSHIRAPGYADMRLIMPEAIRSVRVSHGPYDPRQGDFAIAGSTHMELGMEKPGLLGKATAGSFGTRRLLLAFRPDDREWGESFAAFETYAIDGPGSGRSGERSSFVGHLAWADRDKTWRNVIAIGSARFDFPGFLPQQDVERGLYPYDTMLPLGRDRTSQALAGTEFTWGLENGTISVGAYTMKAKTQIRQNLTGFLVDHNPDDHEQVNDASTFGLSAMYRRRVDLISDRDLVEIGASARVDTVDQSDTRLFPDGTTNTKSIDATINATNIAAYVDAYVYPARRVVVRGGTRFDSLSYSVTDRANNLGLDRTAQGFHVGNKATIDYAAGGGVHLLASYGEGFRSPEARDLAEGARVPFAVVQSGEAGARVKVGRAWQASLVGFASWLDQDRVFDALTRTNIAAPGSSRVGSGAALGGRWGAFGTNVSATYARAVFTGSDANFRQGDPVPYAPRFVLRDDVFVVGKLTTLRGDAVTGRLGAGLQGAAGQTLPDGRAGKNVFYVDALASASWRSLELALNGMNLLGLRYYDAQYVYASTLGRSPLPPGPPLPHVLVATPTSVFATLQVRLEGSKPPDS